MHLARRRRRAPLAAAVALGLAALAGCGSTKALTQPERHIRATPGGRPALLLEPRPRPRTVVLVVPAAGAGPDAIDRDSHLFSLVTALLLRDEAVAAGGDRLALVRWLARRGYTSVQVLGIGDGGPDSVGLIDKVQPDKWVGLSPSCAPRRLARHVGGMPMTYFGGGLGRCPALERTRGAAVTILPYSVGTTIMAQALVPRPGAAPLRP